MAAAAPLVGSRPGGSSAIAITTLSFLPCAAAGCGSRESAAIAVTASKGSFLNMQTLLNGAARMARQIKILCARLSRFARKARQYHDRLGMVACGGMARPDAPQNRSYRAAMRVGNGA